MLRQDFLKASLNDCSIVCFELRRYLVSCFDRDFLGSAASRRDLWRLLLPLPGIIALVADRGNHELMFMDVRQLRKSLKRASRGL